MKKGDRVVCIKSAKSFFASCYIVKGKEYDVVSVYNDGEEECIRIDPTDHRGWTAINFRKIDDQSFTNSLTKELAKKGQKDEFNKLQPNIKEKELS